MQAPRATPLEAHAGALATAAEGRLRLAVMVPWTRVDVTKSICKNSVNNCICTG